MRRSLFLYLFIFASLIALILYVNGRNYQEAIENDVVSLRAKTIEQEQIIDSLKGSSSNAPLNFTLEQHEEARNYFEKLGWTSEQVQQNVTDQLLELNLTEGGNPLVPFTGAGRGFQINDTKFINHKWVLVNFADSNQWGEMLITFTIKDKENISLETTAAVLNDQYR